MQMVLTLIAGANARAGFPQLVEAVAGALGTVCQPIWLAPGRACDIAFDAISPASAERIARGVIGHGEVDVLAQPMVDRRKRLLVADMESTVIENEMLDELGDFLGIRSEIAAITRRAMNGEIDFVAALEKRVELLTGMEARVLEAAARRIRLTAGARQLVATMRAAGALTVLVSGGFMMFAEPVAAELGFDRVIANQLDLVGGRIAGRLRPPIIEGESKREALVGLAAKHGIALSQTMAVGDGANDLPMLAAAGIGIAFHAKPFVTAAARWRIEHADLTGLLYVQGYRDAEFTT
ncbi:MAG: phosphoserine phosphatase SerB [Stellaceae bacterium]